MVWVGSGGWVSGLAVNYVFFLTRNVFQSRTYRPDTQPAATGWPPDPMLDTKHLPHT